MKEGLDSKDSFKCKEQSLFESYIQLQRPTRQNIGHTANMLAASALVHSAESFKLNCVENETMFHLSVPEQKERIREYDLEMLMLDG